MTFRSTFSRLSRALAAMLILHPAATVAAQEGAVADPADVSSIDGIITALYASISGPAGEPRDEERFKSLFARDGRLMPSVSNPDVTDGYLAWTPDDYWTRNSEALTRIGFTEAEIGRTTERFGRITHVFSTYESYRDDRGDSDTPFARGINSIQILHSSDRYWIMSVFWDSERPDNPIPSKYINR